MSSCPHGDYPRGPAKAWREGFSAELSKIEKERRARLDRKVEEDLEAVRRRLNR